MKKTTRPGLRSPYRGNRNVDGASIDAMKSVRSRTTRTSRRNCISLLIDDSEALPRKKVQQKGMNMTHQPSIRKLAEGRTIAVVGDVYRFLATGAETNGKYAVWEAIVPVRGGPPPHVHSREEEGFYILEGEITFTIDAERVVATTGMFANMPVGTPHSFKNESDRPAKMLISVAPAGLEQMFVEVGVPLAEGSTTALPPTKEEIEKLLAIAPKYGVEIRLPGH